jgi:hypothetical protein
LIFSLDIIIIISMFIDTLATLSLLFIDAIIISLLLLADYWCHIDDTLLLLFRHCHYCIDCQLIIDIDIDYTLLIFHHILLILILLYAIDYWLLIITPVITPLITLFIIDYIVRYYWLLIILILFSLLHYWYIIIIAIIDIIDIILILLLYWHYLPLTYIIDYCHYAIIITLITLILFRCHYYWLLMPLFSLLLLSLLCHYY